MAWEYETCLLYTSIVAVQNKNQELADYLKTLEPEDWHNEQEKIRQLMPYKLPAKLVEFLIRELQP